MSSENNYNLNEPRQLNEIALKLRDEYSDYIYSINNIFLENRIIIDKMISAYFFSELSCGIKNDIFSTPFYYIIEFLILSLI